MNGSAASRQNIGSLASGTVALTGRPFADPTTMGIVHQPPMETATAPPYKINSLGHRRNQPGSAYTRCCTDDAQHLDHRYETSETRTK